MNEIEYRRAVDVEVRHAERIIELIAVPYDEETQVLCRGRWITETVDRNAFTGVSGTIHVNRSHDVDQPIGKVVKLSPGDPRGLRADVKIARTAAGDDVLELAEMELLSPSIGFSPEPGGEQYNADRTRRRIVKALLRHIGMVGDPAYAGAKVLAVRAADPTPVARTPTPNLDRIIAERRYAELGLVIEPATSVE